MKIRSIQAVAFALLLQSASFAQETNFGQPTKDNAPCPTFPMPVIKPFADKSKLSIVKPDSGVDFKLIIVNPCASETERLQKPLPLSVLQINDELQAPATNLKFSGSGFTQMPKNNLTQNPFFVLKQP